ncbi:unnamed protein product [Cladocopium goreaui]|uniref:Uncharacterized protein n=1 Tax=Cladocopium goreaui TaxID=2562237 RepID=A0A9P1DB33_9DINO|nr:unnamed protein product [Cladocopium goreaui]
MKVSRRPENSSILTVMSQRERVQGADASFGAAGGFDGGATTNLVLLLVVVVVVENHVKDVWCQPSSQRRKCGMRTLLKALLGNHVEKDEDIFLAWVSKEVQSQTLPE